jgi:cell division protein FtsI/penicillin-binding protein 2
MDNGRLKYLFLFFAFLWIVIFLRLVKVQIIDHAYYVKKANSQYRDRVPLLANRGFILDASKDKLAFNDISFDVNLELPRYKNLSKVEQEKLLTSCAKYFDKTKSFVREKVEKGIENNRHTIQLMAKVSEENWLNLKKLKFPCLVADRLYRRVYNDVANNVIGFVDTDNKGIAGIERQFEELLHGKDGFQTVQRDALGNRFTSSEYQAVEATDGKHLVLTLNKFHQSVLEEELTFAFKTYKARFASGVIMDPYSGEILAISSIPSYNSNKPVNSADGYNHAILDAFEPGSTFKIITAAAALEEGIKKPNDLIYCENGKYRVGPKTYRDDKHSFKYLTFQDVIAKSSNIGSLKVGMEIGAERFYRYIRDFGFGSSTGVMLEGESAGILRKPETWSQISLPTISFGHEIGVTVLQLAQAYSTIANGGMLLRPRIIKEKLNADYTIFEKTEKEEIRRVISENTARTLKGFLESVVTSGTGDQAKNKNFKIGGKTGTAQVFDQVTKTWDTGKVIASFAGMFPLDKPQYVMVIIVDEPNVNNLNYGGSTAAPTFTKIASKIVGFIDDSKIDENYIITNDTNSIYIPDFIGLSVENVKESLADKNIEYELRGEGAYIVQQNPRSGTYQKKNISKLFLVAEQKNSQLMPNLKGLTMREAMRKLARFKVEVIVNGTGVIEEQSLKSGALIQDQMIITLTCQGYNAIKKNIKRN